MDGILIKCKNNKKGGTEMNEITELIIETRKAMGWSQMELAFNVNCSTKTISKLENGKNISSIIFIKVLSALNLNITT